MQNESTVSESISRDNSSLHLQEIEAQVGAIVDSFVDELEGAALWRAIKGELSATLERFRLRRWLAGTNADDAFSVHCGLGETMTPEDILDGTLNCTVLVALERPAEFTEITLSRRRPGDAHEP